MKYSLRQLMYVVTGCCVLLGIGLGYVERRAARQRAVVSSVTRIQGRVYYDCDVPKSDSLSWSKRIARLFGKDRAATVHHIDIISCDDPGTLAAVLGQLKSLGSLKSLSVDGSAVDARCMEQIAAIPSLEELSLAGTRNALPDLTSLSKHRRIRYLGFSSCTGVSEKLLSVLSEMPQLAELDLSFTDATDAASAALSQCKALNELCVEYSEITDTGVIAVSKAPRLQTIYVDPGQATERLRRNVKDGVVHVH